MKSKGNNQWENITCVSDDYMSECKFAGTKCTDLDYSQIQNFTLLLNKNRKMHITPNDFLKNDRRLVNQTIEVNDCNFMIYSRNDHINETVFIMGDIFFENYYVVWDFEQSKIGFNGFFEFVNTPSPPFPMQKNFPVWAIVLIIILGVGLLSGLTYIYIRYRRKQAREQFFLSNEIYDYQPINKSQDVS
jgi:hypothetical protein